MITPTLHAELRSSTVPPLSHLDTKAESLSRWIQELQLEATLVRLLNISVHRTCLNSDSIASGTVKKVIEINPYLLGTMAGGAGMSRVTLSMDLA